MTVTEIRPGITQGLKILNEAQKRAKIGRTFSTPSTKSSIVPEKMREARTTGIAMRIGKDSDPQIIDRIPYGIRDKMFGDPEKDLLIDSTGKTHIVSHEIKK